MSKRINFGRKLVKAALKTTDLTAGTMARIIAGVALESKDQLTPAAKACSNFVKKLAEDEEQVKQDK